MTLTTGTSHLPPVNPEGQLHIAIDRPTCLKAYTKHTEAFINNLQYRAH